MFSLAAASFSSKNGSERMETTFCLMLMSEASLINMALEKNSEINGNSSWKGICISL